MINLEQSLVSGSKTVTAVNGKISAGGSYTSVQKWLNEQGSEPLKSPDGDLVTFFDNIGRYVIQNYRVWTKKSNLADIISTVVHIILNKKSVLQNQPKLKPINWYEGISPKEIQERMIHFIELQTTEFRKYRFEYLKTLKLCSVKTL